MHRRRTYRLVAASSANGSDDHHHDGAVGPYSFPSARIRMMVRSEGGCHRCYCWFETLSLRQTLLRRSPQMMGLHEAEHVVAPPPKLATPSPSCATWRAGHRREPRPDRREH